MLKRRNASKKITGCKKPTATAAVNGTDLVNEPPLSPTEKKIRMAARRKKLLEDGDKEWVTAVESNPDQPA